MASAAQRLAVTVDAGLKATPAKSRQKGVAIRLPIAPSTSSADASSNSKSESSLATPSTRVGPVRFMTYFKNTILDALLAQDWQQVSDEQEGEWDFYWADVGWLKEMDHMYLPDHCRINHFRNFYELTRKNLCSKNLKRYKRELEKQRKQSRGAGAFKSDGRHEMIAPWENPELDVLPATFDLPAEYHLFVEHFRKIPNSTWIMKPTGSSQGKGIFLITSLNQISDWKKDSRWAEIKEGEKEVEEYIIQRYVENPYLVSGKKFDLRIYVLVRSYQPLVVWLYRGGFARFSGSLFSMDKEHISNSFIHLTNVAVQKTAKDYDSSRGCKWYMSQLKQYLKACHGEDSVERCFQKIDNIIIRTLKAVQPVIIHDKHCFEVYGYDILLDDTLTPWLIEVNASPSMVADTPTDYQLKLGLLEDVFAVVDMDKRLGGEERRVGSFDLIWNDGPVYKKRKNGKDMLEDNVLNSHLGAHMGDRKEQLSRVYSESLKARNWC